MYRKEQIPGWLQLSIQALPWIPGGACFGFVCAVAILSAQVSMFLPQSGITPQIWQTVFYYSATKGALLGAIYVPIAYLLLLPCEHMIKALIAVAIATVVFGIVGLKWIGPIAPISISASFGFWGACAAIYRQGMRRARGAGFQSYFS